jgi:N-acetylmuramoyl-L-alanine amidase
MALKRVWIPSPNYSSRGGASVRLIVLHTTEGARTYQDLGAFFARSSSGVSSQVGIDDTLGTIGEYVKRANKAWTQGNANPVSTSAEQCAFAAWTGAEWDKHPNMLANTAAWIAEEAAFYNIPIVKLTPAQAQGSGRGVCGHVDLGSWGGGHTDPGKGYPWDKVLAMAKGQAPEPIPPTPAPTTTPGDSMYIKNNNIVYQLIYSGPQSYWRSLPGPAAALIPAAWVIDDKNGELLKLWKVGAGG